MKRVLHILFIAAALCSASDLVAQVAPRGALAFPQPGDQVQVRVWPQSAFGPPFTGAVDPFGRIVLPPVGQIDVSSIPIRELRDTLTQRLSKFIRNPEVDVTVLRRITVNGAVLKPDVYYTDVSASLRDVIARAGGITEVGSRKKVSIVRGGETIRVPNWERDTTQTSVLRSGDVVLVGRRTWLEINIIPVASLGLATASFLLSLRR